MEYPSPIPPFGGAGLGQQANPWFTVANQFVPRNLHDVIRWARFIAIQSPTTSEVIRKLATYPITDFIIDTEQEGTKLRYEKVLKSFKLKEALQDAGFEFFTIGNVFLSIYFPIHRELECPQCKTRHNAKKASWATFKQWQFAGSCPVCDYTGVLKRIDSRSYAIDDMNLIKWIPEHIMVNHNPITGESEYYYKIPNSIRQKVQRGDRLFIDSLPWAFVDAVRYNQDFKFDKGSLFHLKNISSGGTVEGIAVPPLLSLFTLVFYQATLRKANEAIALEYLTPMRVVFPQAQTSNDPAVVMSLRNFRMNMEDALRRHKQDKNQILVAPMAIGYQALSGEGKNLLVAQEIQQAEQTILLSLGVSQELLSGTTNWTSSSVGLRMMENLLTSYIGRLQDMIDWITTTVASYLTMEPAKVSLVPFKLLDDDNFKALLAQLAKDGDASKHTLFEELGLDWNDEQEKIKEEAVIRARMQVEAQYEVGEAEFVSARAQGDKMADNEEYQNLLMKAQGLTQQLMGADPATQMQFLGQLKVQDYGMYLMVAKMLNDNQGAGAQQAGAEGQEQGGKAGAQDKDAKGGKPGEEGQEGEQEDPNAEGNPDVLPANESGTMLNPLPPRPKMQGTKEDGEEGAGKEKKKEDGKDTAKAPAKKKEGK